MIFEDDDALKAGTFSYQEVLKTVKEVDPALFEVMVRSLPTQNWHTMVADLQAQKPEVFEKLRRVVDALKKGQGSVKCSPRKPTIIAAWELADDLKASYQCNTGFVDEVKPQHTAIVYLKLPEIITGLPRDIMVMSTNLAKDYGSKRKWTFGFDNRMFVVDLEDDALIEIIKSDLVERVEVPPMARILANNIPEYNPAGVNTDWGVTRINPHNAWGLGNFGKSTTGRSIKICVVDTGIKSAHPAFWKDGICVYKGGYNFVSGGSNPADDHDHGTYCASIVAAQHNGLAGSYRGVAPEIWLYACKVLDSKGSGSMANVAAGVDWARTNGMDIISMSLGGSAGAAALETACNAAWYAGILVVVAAGNSGPGDNTVNYPAKYASCMAVAASDFNDNIASFSSRGAESEVSAPGRYITGAWAGFTYKDYVIPGSGDKYMCASGTSAACPHVAGGAGLLKAWYPAMTNVEMRQWIRDKCRDL